MKNFMHKDVECIDWIPFDIETTGFKATDEITTFCLQHDDTYHTWVHSPSGIADVDDLTVDVENTSNLDVELYECPDEESLLKWVDAYLSDNVDESNSVIVAYNGEKWKGGFDLPFVRTRCVMHGMDFLLKGYEYTDPLEIFGGREKARFNTTIPSILGANKSPLQSFCDYIDVDSDGTKAELKERLEQADYEPADVQAWAEEHNNGDVPTRDVGDLVGVHDLLVKPSLDDWEDYDPFDDSALAVKCFEEQNYLDLILHNLADVEKTTHVTDVMLAHAPKYEFRPKTL